MKLKIFLLAAITIIFTASSYAEEGENKAITPDKLIEYLEHMISGHRQAMTLTADPGDSRETLIAEELRQNSSRVINYTFDFGRAKAAAIERQQPTVVYGPVIEGSRRQNLMKITATVEQRIKDVQTALENEKDSAKRDKLNSELKLAKAQSELLQNVLALPNNNGVEEVGLVKKVTGLAKTVPEVTTEQQRKNPKNITSPVVVPQQKATSAPSRGIIALVGDLYSIFNKKATINSAAEENASLKVETAQMQATLRDTLREEVKRGDEIAKAEAGEGENSLANQTKQLDNLVADFKTMGSALVPLNQVLSWQDAVARSYAEWDDLLQQDLNRTLNILVLRLIVLAVAIAIPIVLSRFARRAIIKYTKDGRRQRQFQTLRKIVFGIIIGLIVVLNLITESGSLLTFAGFLTAGLAVALQNVILSLVAHFFYFGKFGVREGDRVTVGGITGEVIKIGMVRLYIMELAGKDLDFYPTGRIVTFPNSILFQPAAFTKLVPGTSFTWNEVRIILDQSTDFELANQKLLEAVELVYKEYEEDMQHQQEALQRATHLNISIPRPEGFVKFVDAGIAFVVRYPVNINDSGEIHDRITRKLIEAIRAEPNLKLRG